MITRTGHHINAKFPPFPCALLSQMSLSFCSTQTHTHTQKVLAQANVMKGNKGGISQKEKDKALDAGMYVYALVLLHFCVGVCRYMVSLKIQVYIRINSFALIQN